MRGLVAVLAAALIAPALTTTGTATAHAAPVNPASAVRKHLIPNHGVTFSELVKVTRGKKLYETQRVKGVYQFGKSGIVASKGTRILKFSKKAAADYTKGSKTPEEAADYVKAAESPTHIIQRKGAFYVKGGAAGYYTPADKPWVLVSVPSLAPVPLTPSNQGINVFEPRTLQTLLDNAVRKGPGGTVNGTKTTLYRGTITYGELYRLSPSFRAELDVPPDRRTAKLTMSWRIWIDGKGLPRRLFARGTNVDTDGKKRFRIDTRYDGWGSPVVITPPAKDQVIGILDLPLKKTEQEEMPITLNPVR